MNENERGSEYDNEFDSANNKRFFAKNDGQIKDTYRYEINNMSINGNDFDSNEINVIITETYKVDHDKKYITQKEGLKIKEKFCETKEKLCEKRDQFYEVFFGSEDENNKKLKEDNSKLHNDKIELKKEISDLYNSNERLKEDNSKLHNDKIELKKEISDLYNSNKNLTRQLENLDGKNKELKNKHQELKNEHQELKNEHQELESQRNTLLTKIVDFNKDAASSYNSGNSFSVAQIHDEFTKIKNQWDIFLSEHCNISSKELEIESEIFFGDRVAKLLETIKQNLKAGYGDIIVTARLLNQQSEITSIEKSILDSNYLSSNENSKYGLEKIIDNVLIVLNNCYKNSIDVDFIMPKPGDLFNEEEHETYHSSSNKNADPRNKKIQFCVFPGVFSITSRRMSGEKSKTCQLRAAVYTI